MKRALHILSTFLLLLTFSCSDESVPAESVGTGHSLQVNISNMKETNPVSSRVAYSGAQGEHTEFGTGDVFGLFVLGEDGSVRASNVKVYCSGLDNNGATVWSIYKEGDTQGNSSNYPIADILGLGSTYFAYYPYNEALGSATGAETLQAYVTDFMNTLSADQSRSLADHDLLVASNIPDCEYGDVHVENGGRICLTFSHALAMLRFHLPEGAVRYDYLLDNEDFIPYFVGTADGLDEYRYLFKPGNILDICIKYVHEGRLYRFETGVWKVLSPILTASGHCYTMDEDIIKVPYNTAVDMGTSVMWASFNLGAEDDLTVTSDNISTLKGICVMWGANMDTGNYGNSAYIAYNNGFTNGTKPNQLPIGYSFTGDPLYDAATKIWGGKWRTPTVEEWRELFKVCTYNVSNGIVTFTSTKTGNTISLKQAGYYDSSNPTSVSTGYYWSSSASTENSIKAFSTIFNNGSASINTNANRYTGLPVRPVLSI
ncbi:MAG: fimbrillin family protein [Prevotella sp.]